MEEVKETVVEEAVDAVEVVEEVQEQPEEVFEEKSLKESIEDLKKDLADRKAQMEKDEQEHQERMKVLWDKEVNLKLKMAGLDDFKEFLHFEQGDSKSLQVKIEKFQEVIGKRELSGGFVPSNHRSADKYTLAEKSKDTKSMIGTKLSGLFK